MFAVKVPAMPEIKTIANSKTVSNNPKNEAGNVSRRHEPLAYASDVFLDLHFSCCICPLRAVVLVNSAPQRGQVDFEAVPDFSR